MVRTKMEQATPVFDLQFFAEEAVGPASPPPVENNLSEPVTNVQAGMPTAGNQEPKGPVDYETYQSAVRAMNESQKAYAPFKSVAEQIGIAPEQLPQYLQQANQGLQFITQVNQIRQFQGDQAAQAFINQQLGFSIQNPPQQFTQQPQQGLAAEVMRELAAEDPDSAELYGPVINKMASVFEKKINSLQEQVAPVNQYFNEYQVNQKVATASQNIAKVAAQAGKMVDDGKGGKVVDPQFEDAVFKYAAQNGIKDPGMFEVAAIQMLGGFTALQQIAIQNYVKELQTKQPPSTTLTTPGTQAVEVKDYTKMKPEDMWEAMKNDTLNSYNSRQNTT